MPMLARPPRFAHACSIIWAVAVTAQVPHLRRGACLVCRRTDVGAVRADAVGLVGMVDGEDVQPQLVRCERRGDEVGVVHGVTAGRLAMASKVSA